MAGMAIPLARLGQAASNPSELARKAMKNHHWLEELLRGLDADKAPIKYGCAKALRILSEQHPELLYPRFDLFVGLLDHKNKILQWEAAFVVSQLARVDSDGKFAAIFDKYFSPIAGPVMITAANVIRGGARIAQAKPHLADRNAAHVVKVAGARYQTRECRNVAIGHAILALREFFCLLGHPAPALRLCAGSSKTHGQRPARRRSNF